MTTCELRLPGTGTLEVRRGPALLAGLADGPGLVAHERRFGALPPRGWGELAAQAEGVGLRGRGGAGFPFGRKLRTTAKGRGRAVVVVNLAEGEPASHKDAALAQVAPHLVLDGASATAAALGTTEVHVVLPGHAPLVGGAVRAAISERITRGRDGRVQWQLRDATDVFVAGQSAAVLELISGRPNLPVTQWRPSAESGHRRRPTLLSNAETFAQLGLLVLVGTAAYCAAGTPDEPGTTLLTLDGDGRAPVVLEVPYGAAWTTVVPDHRLAGPVLLGGYHGTWARDRDLLDGAVSAASLSTLGLGLGAGVVLPVDQKCPVERTNEIVSYLASQSARRCGPCFSGLPALAAALEAVVVGRGGVTEVERLGELIDGRGACAHPDGTVRLVRSMVTAFGDEVSRHVRGDCSSRWAETATLRLSSPWLEVSA